MASLCGDASALAWYNAWRSYRTSLISRGRNALAIRRVNISFLGIIPRKAFYQYSPPIERTNIELGECAMAAR